MKPIRLVMEGFGPYLRKTEIDFESLGQGLTLITGNTGAGKTTLFDAICCALFGETSGKSRSFSQMRSEMAGAKDDTKIIFEFELRGKRYLVERTPKYSRPKVRGEGLREVPARAVLTYPDGRIVEKVNSVTEEVKDLLGIDKDEFRQIVMIAQNDFMAMIKDTTGNQEKTFSRIFDTSLYKRFDEKVKEECKKAKEEVSHLELKIKDEVLRVELKEEVKNELLAKPPYDLEAIQEALLDQSEYLSSLYPVKKQELNEQKEKLAAKMKETEQARILNKDIESLEKIEKERQELTQKSENIKDLEVRCERAETARDAIGNDYHQCRELEARIKETGQKIRAKIQEYRGLEGQLEETKKELEKYPAEKLERLKSETSEIEKQMPIYKEVSEKEEQRDQLSQEFNTSKKKETTLEETIKENERKLSEITRYETSYFESRISQEELKKTKINSGHNDLSTLTADIESLEESLQDYLKDREEVYKLDKSHTEAKQNYDKIFERYINSQASFLASKLESGEPCPVCGSTEHPHLAQGDSDQTITKEAFEKSQSRYETLRNRLTEKAERLGAEEEQLDKSLKAIKGLGDLATKFSDILEIEVGLNFQDYLTKIKELISQGETVVTKNDLKKAYATLEKQLDLLDTTFLERLGEIDEEISTLQDQEKSNEENCKTYEHLENENKEKAVELEKVKTKNNALGSELSTLEALIKEKRQGLSFESLETAKEALEKNQADIKNFETEQKKFEEKQEKQTAQLNHLLGEGQGLRDEETQQKEELAEAEKVLEEKLKINGFKDREDYLQALLSPEILGSYKKEIEDHKNALLLNTQEIDRLTKVVAGRERPDLEALNNEQSELNEAIENINQEIAKIQVDQEEITKVSKKLKSLGEDLKEQKKLYTTLYGLDQKVNKRGGSFSQYVLSVYFRRILNKANLKLAEMTNGVYQLVQPDEGKLGIEVFDATTGKAREIKTLSGGETFTASLALALGFSEVVEEENGGVRLDTIFIDEGFGSLDPDYLERAIDVLSKLSKDRRVAIISHVEQLKDRIEQQIIVEKKNDSSYVRLITG